MNQNQKQTAEILGVHFCNCTMQEALAQLDSMVEQGHVSSQGPKMAAFINAHCLNLAYKDKDYTSILNTADAVWPDGSGVRLAGKMLGITVQENVNGTDMFPLMCGRGHSIFMLGGAPGVARVAMEKASHDHPDTSFVGEHHGFLSDKSLEAKAIEAINNANPDILLVAMGVPLQEKWIAQHRHQLKCGVAVAVGGLLDFVSGRIPRAPLWMRHIGMEWLYRLYQEPIRLFKRYVIGNPLFLFRVWKSSK